MPPILGAACADVNGAYGVENSTGKSAFRWKIKSDSLSRPGYWNGGCRALLDWRDAR